MKALLFATALAMAAAPVASLAQGYSDDDRGYSDQGGYYDRNGDYDNDQDRGDYSDQDRYSSDQDDSDNRSYESRSYEGRSYGSYRSAGLHPGEHYTGRVGSTWRDAYGRDCAWREVSWWDRDGNQAYRWVQECRD